MTRLILASTSPRRKELLALLGVPFDVALPECEETLGPARAPEELARSFALEKARTCARCHPDSVVVGSDTLIEIDRKVIGKPADAAEARSMLRRLQGRLHFIYTAVAVVHISRAIELVGVEAVHVKFRLLSDREIDEYVATGEGLDKAGAYSIQGAGGELIAKIVGDFSAAVGLPLRLTARLLGQAGVPLGVSVEDLYRRKPYPNWSRFAP
jgi:septum formation protein